MQFYQALSAILDDNWSVIDQKKQLFIFIQGDCNKLKENKLFLKPRYFSKVVEKYLPPGTKTPASFSVLFVKTNSNIKAFVYTNELKKQKEKKLPLKSKEPTFLTIVAAFSNTDWKNVPKVINTLDSTEEYWDQTTSTLGLIKGSNAQEVVFRSLNAAKDFTLEIHEPKIHKSGSHVPDLLLGYSAKLGNRKGVLNTGLSVETIDDTTGSATCSTTTVSHDGNILHTFTKKQDGETFTYTVDGKPVSSDEVSRITGELLLKQWII